MELKEGSALLLPHLIEGATGLQLALAGARYTGTAFTPAPETFVSSDPVLSRGEKSHIIALSCFGDPKNHTERVHASMKTLP